jgi:hypothetical protein
MTDGLAAQRAPVDSDKADLLRRALARDAQAFRTILQRYNRRLYRIVKRVGSQTRPGTVEAAVRTIIIRWAGEDPDRDGLLEAAFAGYAQDPSAIITADATSAGRAYP